MIKGTTPTLIFKVDTDLRTAVDISLTFRQKGQNILTLGLADLTVTKDDISVVLTQEISKRFSVEVPLQMQLKAKTADGKVISHTPPISTSVKELFDMRVM